MDIHVMGFDFMRHREHGRRFGVSLGCLKKDAGASGIPRIFEILKHCNRVIKINIIKNRLMATTSVYGDCDDGVCSLGCLGSWPPESSPSSLQCLVEFKLRMPPKFMGFGRFISIISSILKILFGVKF